MPPTRNSSINGSFHEPSTTRTRKAPGSRGPEPSSCSWCRRLRAKCVRPLGGKVGEEDCTACLKKGIECQVPQEITRRTPMIPKAEEGIVTTQLSIARGTGLFELYLDESRVGVETNFIPLFVHDPKMTQARFDAVGGKLEGLEAHEQLRCRLIWAAAAKRWLTLDQSTIESEAKSVQLLKSAQDLADTSSVWRTPTMSNYTSLLLLYFVTAFGDLGKEESQYYLFAACTHFRHLFRSTESLYSFEGRAEWAAWAVAIIDTARALDTATNPLLTPQDFAIFVPSDVEPDYLPDPSFLATFLPNQTLQLIDHLTHAVTFYVHSGREIAFHFAQLYIPRVEEDFKMLQSVWNRSDRLASWTGECFELFWKETLGRSSGLTAFRSSMVGNWLLPLFIEFAILRYLDRRLVMLSESRADFPNDSTSSVNFSSLASLYSVADMRCKRSLCIFLRHTRNQDGVYFLSAAAGYQISVDRLNELARSLETAPVDNYDLFPVGTSDKLSSVTFLLKTLENTQMTYQSARLGASIARLTTLQSTLEAQVGYRGEAALALFTSPTPSNASAIPSGPASVLLQAASFVHKGSL